jgi:hypothetical protein
LQRESGCQSIWGKTKPAYLKATLIGQLRRSSPRRRQLRHQWIDFLALSPVPGRSFEAALIFWCKVDASVSQYRRRGGSVDAGSRPALSRRSGSRRSWNERTSSCPMAVQFVAPKLLSQDAWWASGLLLTTAALFRGLKTRAAAPRRPFCVITILMANRTKSSAAATKSK